MIKNNFIALLVHCCVNLVGFIVLAKGGQGGEIFDKTILLVIFVVGSFLYFFSAKKLLIRHNSLLKNFLSVSIIIPIGFFIWIFCYWNYISSPNDAFRDLIWLFYLMYNMSSYSLLDLFISNMDTGHESFYIWDFMVLIFPSLIMAVSIPRNRKETL